jgi:ribonuclease Y
MIIPFIAFCAGSFLVYIFFHLKYSSIKDYQKLKLLETESLKERMLHEAALSIKERELHLKSELKIEEETKRYKLLKWEETLRNQQNDLSTKLKKCEKKEQQLNEKSSQLDTNQKSLDKKTVELSGMTREEAKEYLLNSLISEAKKESLKTIQSIEIETKEIAEVKAKKILETAIQRITLPSLNAISISGVPIDNEEIKGRIVGKEGRNIRTFEELTGTTLLMDESPHSILISCFDPIRREIAQRALRILINDGKIFPTRIEEVVHATKIKVDEIIREKGEEGACKACVTSLHPELIKLLGKLHFRYSLGQNVLDHSIEVSQLLGLIAEEVGGNGNLARRIGLLHDIGKALDELKGKSHAIIGMEWAKKFGEKEEVSNGIGCHHFEIEALTLEGSLCNVADSISAGRTGARLERLDYYVRRMQDLESIANEIQGVEKIYALQMGKEIRVIVHPECNTNDALHEIARSVRERIQNRTGTAGKVKMTLSCEKKFIEMI